MTTRAELITALRSHIVSWPDRTITEDRIHELADLICPLTTPHVVALTDWERGELSRHASGAYLTYASHELFEREKPVMEGWKILAEKLR